MSRNPTAQWPRRLMLFVRVWTSREEAGAWPRYTGLHILSAYSNKSCRTKEEELYFAKKICPNRNKLNGREV